MNALQAPSRTTSIGFTTGNLHLPLRNAIVNFIAVKKYTQGCKTYAIRFEFFFLLNQAGIKRKDYDKCFTHQELS